MTFNTTEGPTFSMSIENKDTLIIEASVPNNMWLGIGFGKDMHHVDMVQFRATGNGIVSDLWADDHVQPTIDSIQSYTRTTVTQANNTYNFVTYRKLDTGDSSQDSAIECDEDYDWVDDVIIDKDCVLSIE